MQVSEVQIIPIKPKNGMVGVASCVLDGCYYIGDIAVFSKIMGGYRLVYPTKLIGEKKIPLHHPIERDTGAIIHTAITQHAERLFSA